MENLDSLRKLAGKLEKLKEKVESKPFFFSGLLKKRYLKVKQKHKTQLHYYLLNHSSEYSALVKAQDKLLIGSEITLNVMRARNTMTNSHATGFNGLLRENGELFLKLKTSDISIGYQYSSSYSGSIDSFGIVSMSASRTQSSVMESFPTKYKGKISYNGEFTINSVRSESELLTQGMGLTMVGIISIDTKNINQFHSNREALTAIKNSFNTDLLASY